MKAVKLIFLCVCLTVLSGCGDYGEKRIVKLITISDEEIVAYCYDFEQDKRTQCIKAIITELGKR